jgi:hypothetical protein
MTNSHPLCRVLATFPQSKVLSTVDNQLLRTFTTLRPGTNLNTKYIHFYPYQLTSKPPPPLLPLKNVRTPLQIQRPDELRWLLWRR